MFVIVIKSNSELEKFVNYCSDKVDSFDIDLKKNSIYRRTCNQNN